MANVSQYGQGHYVKKLSSTGVSDSIYTTFKGYLDKAESPVFVGICHLPTGKFSVDLSVNGYLFQIREG